MAKEDKELLIKDLSARLLYGTIVSFNSIKCVVENVGRDGSISLIGNDNSVKKAVYLTKVNFVKPYLRPMSSMTEEEEKEYAKLQECVPTYYYAFGDIVEDYEYFDSWASIDWLYEHHFDYHSLIEKDLAIEVTEENNPYKL